MHSINLTPCTTFIVHGVLIINDYRLITYECCLLTLICNDLIMYSPIFTVEIVYQLFPKLGVRCELNSTYRLATWDFKMSRINLLFFSNKT